MTEISETSPCYLTLTQSEGGAWADHTPYDSLLHLAFKHPFLKAAGEFESFEHELPVLPAWPHTGCLAINILISFITTGVSRLALLSIEWADPSLAQ